jgi:hypothetical protein
MRCEIMLTQWQGDPLRVGVFSVVDGKLKVTIEKPEYEELMENIQEDYDGGDPKAYLDSLVKHYSSASMIRAIPVKEEVDSKDAQLLRDAIDHA